MSQEFPQEFPQGGRMALHEVYQEIMSRAPEHDFDPSLDRMAMVLDFLGHPEKSFRVIHVTGTNGKGSTSYMAESLCRAYGLRTGLYTSPHIQSVTERISIDGQHVSDEQFVDLYYQVKDFIDMADQRSIESGGPRMSFFEVLTVMAVWAFADAPVDVAIVEVGMGGTWDATNVLDADAAVIGPVDMDHMQWLGDSVEQIAAEKAGIIKQGSSVIVGPQEHASVMPVIEEGAARAGAVSVQRDGQEINVVERMPAVGGQLATLQTGNGIYRDIPVSAFGRYQAHNAVAALAAAETVIPVSGQLDTGVVSQALQTVRIPGRVEIIRSSPTIILDGGHNIQAVGAVRDAIEENFDFRQLIGVVSMMKDKDVESVLGIMEPILEKLIVTQNSWGSRVMPADELESIAIGVFGPDRVIRQDSLPDAIQQAVDLVDSDDDLGVGYGHGILVFGSFVTVGDARTLLEERPGEQLEHAVFLHDAHNASSASRAGDEDPLAGYLQEVMHDGLTDIDYYEPDFDGPVPGHGNRQADPGKGDN